MYKFTKKVVLCCIMFLFLGVLALGEVNAAVRKPVAYGVTGKCIHAYSTQRVQAPTCKKTGKSVVKCKKCGYVKNTVTLPKLSHDSKKVVYRSVSSSTMHIKQVSCSMCKVVQSTVQEKHLFKSNNVCKKCNYKKIVAIEISKREECKHTYNTIEQRASTCNTSGKLIEKCKKCGYIKTTVLKKLEHIPEKVVYNINSLDPNTHTKKIHCSVCGEIQELGEKHEFNSKDKCSKCGQKKERIYIGSKSILVMLNQTASLPLTLGEGYSIADFQFYSNDNKIVTVNSNGEVTGKKIGKTYVKILNKKRYTSIWLSNC